MCAHRLKKFDAKCVSSWEKWNRVVSVDAQKILFSQHNVRVCVCVCVWVCVSVCICVCVYVSVKEIILLVNYERR